jgi:uncharacterized coiled-coil protein SlyX
MNVLSDFEIRLKKYFPDTAEQDQIFKLGTQVIEQGMIIEKQAAEIVNLTKKVAKVKPKKKEPGEKANTPVKKQIKETAKETVRKSIKRSPKAKIKTANKTTPLKTGKIVKRSNKIK